MTLEKEWFEEWFDTDYYHILYSNRDLDEAEAFIGSLMLFLSLKNDAKILDLACGKGRHSVQLNSLGYSVVGVDLSNNSIADAAQFESETLKFKVADMREVVAPNEFDAVLNLFTSFGYFNCFDENIKVLNSIKTDLKPGGIFVIDFMNCNKVVAHLSENDEIQKENILFNISKKIEDGQIVKTISFENQGTSYEYHEKVQLLLISDFENMIASAGLNIDAVFGDYNLQKFDVESSDRLIIVGRKAVIE